MRDQLSTLRKERMQVRVVGEEGRRVQMSALPILLIPKPSFEGAPDLERHASQVQQCGLADPLSRLNPH